MPRMLRRAAARSETIPNPRRPAARIHAGRPGRVPNPAARHAQIAQFCARNPSSQPDENSTQNGGCARVLLELLDHSV
jgi:hypothetical protein